MTVGILHALSVLLHRRGIFLFIHLNVVVDASAYAGDFCSIHKSLL